MLSAKITTRCYSGMPQFSCKQRSLCANQQMGLSKHVFLDYVLLLYVWNAALVLGKDLPCSLVTIGCIFLFLIEFSVSKLLELISSPKTVESFAKNQTTLLAVEGHCNQHRNLLMCPGQSHVYSTLVTLCLLIMLAL